MQVHHAANGASHSPVSAEEVSQVRQRLIAASLLPPRVYHDPDVLQFELAEWFTKGWLCIGREEDIALKGQYVAVGAHNDHVGISGHPVDHDSLRAFNAVVRPGGAESDSRAPTAAEQAQIKSILDSLRKIRKPRLDSINNGADDDGSGTVTVLGIAEALVKANVKPKRSIIFV